MYVTKLQIENVSHINKNCRTTFILANDVQKSFFEAAIQLFNCVFGNTQDKLANFCLELRDDPERLEKYLVFRVGLEHRDTCFKS